MAQGRSAWWRLQMVLLSLLIASTGFAILGASAPQSTAASPSCVNQGCNFVNPALTNCPSDAQIWDSHAGDSDTSGMDDYPLQYLQLRLSPSCESGGGREYAVGSPYPYTAYWTSASFQADHCCGWGRDGNYWYDSEYHSDSTLSAAIHYSWMSAGGPWSPDGWVRNCEYGDYSECTGWH